MEGGTLVPEACNSSQGVIDDEAMTCQFQGRCGLFIR